MNDIYLAFGSNLGDPMAQIRGAWESLRREPIIEIVACSPLYRTAPVGGPAGQPDYVNAVCRARSERSARDILGACIGIERRMGRERTLRWGPRTIDIDLLLFGDEVIDEPGLSVPHPRLRERLFVLVPLSDVAPDAFTLAPDHVPLGGVLRAALSRSGETLRDWHGRQVA